MERVVCLIMLAGGRGAALARPALLPAATTSRTPVWGRRWAGRAGAAPPGVLKVGAEFLCL